MDCRKQREFIQPKSIRLVQFFLETNTYFKLLTDGKESVKEKILSTALLDLADIEVNKPIDEI